MPVNVNHQTVVFTACIITGIISGVFCDILGLVSRKLRFKKGAVFVKDILFWTMALAFFFSVIYNIDGAALRWYVFPGGGFGALIYILVFRKVTLKIVSAMLNFLTRIVRAILKILSFPVGIMAKFLHPISGFVQNVLKKIKKFVQKNIEKVRRIRLLLNKV